MAVLIRRDVRRRGIHIIQLILMSSMLMTAPASPSWAQSGTALVPVTDETAMLAQGWAGLAAGDAGVAAERAQSVLRANPHSVGALTLLIEVDLARGSSTAALGSYEAWLGSRRLEPVYLLRRIAFESLRESSRSRDARRRLAALKALAAEGDATATAALAAASQKGQYAETLALAELGNEEAIRSLLKRLEQAPGVGKLTFIEGLARSRSRLAVTPLVSLLRDGDPLVVASAADALGRIDARDAIDRLRPLVEDTQAGPVRWAAARALASMGDAAGSQFLREQLASGHPMLEIDAAQALAPLGLSSDWLEVARKHLGGKDPMVRLKAARVVAPYDQQAAQSMLEGLAQDPNPAIREQATELLATRVANDFATLRRLLRSPDGLTSVQAGARIIELTR